MNVEQIAAPLTHDLRRRVLRNGDADAEVVWPEDVLDHTAHFGMVTGDRRVVGISTWIATGPDVQLRGMATDPDFAGQGVGSALLDAGIAWARAQGAKHLWANARVTAVDFYERYGFTVSGPEFVTPSTGLPHRLATLELV